MTFNKEQTKILQKALDTYGIDKQLDIAIEEMSELTKAIIKHRRYASRETYENLCEETADVAIMVEQIFLTTKRDDIAKYAVAKIDRLKQRLDDACIPHYRCVKCGKTITEEEIIKGCKACSPKAMSRYEHIKQLPIDKMAGLLAEIVIQNVAVVVNEPIPATVKKMIKKEYFDWLLGEVKENENSCY